MPSNNIVTNNKTVNIKNDKNIYKSFDSMNDLKSVFSHYDPKTGRNVTTENKLKNKE